MDTIYITGHRNPDTDSIVSAMAYAAPYRSRPEWQPFRPWPAAGRGRPPGPDQ